MDTPSPVQLFKWLSDETRVRMVLLIALQSELCVCELTCALDEPQPKVSRHLAYLRMSGLLEDRRQGRRVYYRLNRTTPSWVSEVLAVLLKARLSTFDRDVKRLESMEERSLRAAV